MDHKNLHSICPSCLHHTILGGRFAILHMMMFLWLWTAMTFPLVRVSLLARVWSHSCIWCGLAREGWNGWRASPHPPDYWLGKTLQRGLDDLSDGWMTLQLWKWKCKLPSTHIPAWCTTSLVTSGLTLMLKSCKDWSLREMSGAQVWVLACLIPFPTFLVILSLVSLFVPLPLSWLLEWIASSS
jgi:hypothetical protein